MEFLSNGFFLIALTFGSYFLGKLLRKRTGWAIMHPVLVSICILILFLQLTGISYETYNRGGSMIEFWLKPAVVALGVPLYQQLETIKKQFLPIFVAELAGCIVGIVSVVLIAKVMGASREVILSLAPKSVTMGFARVKSPVAQGLSMGTAAHAIGTATSMEVSKLHGAYASLGLTLNGILTAMLAPSILSLMGI